MKHEVSALVEYARIRARVHCTTGSGFYEDIMRHPLTATLFTQYSVRKGIKVFKEAGITAVEEKLQQFETRKVMEPIDGNEMTREEKRVCLQYRMFLKQKRSGRIKGRGCADGQKKRKFITKEESSVPTISTEALFLTCIIDALEKRGVTMTDIPGVFMQADMDEIVNMNIEGKMAQPMTKIDPKEI